MLLLFRGSRKNIYQKGFYYLQNIKKLRPLNRGNALKNEKNQIIKIVTLCCNKYVDKKVKNSRIIVK
jgi:hypothetical protein